MLFHAKLRAFHGGVTYGTMTLCVQNSVKEATGELQTVEKLLHATQKDKGTVLCVLPGRREWEILVTSDKYSFFLSQQTVACTT